VENKDKENGDKYGRVSSDALLQSIRRIDWRFLLPDPRLSDVVYLGLQRTSLIEALDLFSDSLTIIHHLPFRIPSTKKYQTIVACSPTSEMLDLTTKLVCPGGSLYVEVYGLWGSINRWSKMREWLRSQRHGMGFPKDYLMYIQRLGFSDVKLFWHWPDFETCTKIIPLQDKEVIRYALKAAGSGLENRVKTRFVLELLTSGLLTWTVPCFSIIARWDKA